MKKFKAKWNNEDVYVHFIPRNKTYVIVSKEESEEDDDENDASRCR